jgi:F0F1-type ATP synthase alpha subunit
VEDVSRFETELFDYLTATKQETLSSIRETGVLSPEAEATLREAIAACKQKA